MDMSEDILSQGMSSRDLFVTGPFVTGHLVTGNFVTILLDIFCRYMLGYCIFRHTTFCLILTVDILSLNISSRISFIQSLSLWGSQKYDYSVITECVCEFGYLFRNRQHQIGQTSLHFNMAFVNVHFTQFFH